MTFDDSRPSRIFYENGDYVYEPGDEPTRKGQSFLWNQSACCQPRVADVTSNEYQMKCLLSLVAARQRAIDVSNGIGLRYVLCPDEGEWESTEVDDDYEGSPIVENDNRCRPYGRSDIAGCTMMNTDLVQLLPTRICSESWIFSR